MRPGEAGICSVNTGQPWLHDKHCEVLLGGVNTGEESGGVAWENSWMDRVAQKVRSVPEEHGGDTEVCGFFRKERPV